MMPLFQFLCMYMCKHVLYKLLTAHTKLQTYFSELSGQIFIEWEIVSLLLGDHGNLNEEAYLLDTKKLSIVATF